MMMVSLARARILIVEDEGVLAMEIKMALLAMGHSVVGIASSGEKALKLIEESTPNLILLDIKLFGEMDGIQVAEEVRKRYGIPVVFVTAHSDPDTMARATLTAPQAFLEKPVEESQFQEVIQRIMEN